jgi:hypothetical protein
MDKVVNANALQVCLRFQRHSTDGLSPGKGTEPHPRRNRCHALSATHLAGILLGPVHACTCLPILPDSLFVGRHLGPRSRLVGHYTRHLYKAKAAVCAARAGCSIWCSFAQCSAQLVNLYLFCPRRWASMTRSRSTLLWEVKLSSIPYTHYHKVRWLSF